MNKSITADEAESLYEVYSGVSEYCAVLDSDFRVLKSSNERLFSIGECMAEHFCGRVYIPLKKLTVVRVYKRDKIYCGRLYPHDRLIVCELLTSADIIQLSELTDMASRILPVYASAENNAAAMWDQLEKLRGEYMNGDISKLTTILDLESRLTAISSANRNLYEYYKMCFSEPSLSILDACALCNHLVERCNAALSKCGRHIELLTQPEPAYIRADGHRAATALINALQNALLYSPRESVPLITVYLSEINGQRYVEISVVNDNVMFTNSDFSSGVDLNYDYQRAGYGIPIIRRFAESCRGRLTISDENGKKRVKLIFPYAGERGSEIRLEKDSAARYQTGIPDLLDIRMQEVAELFKNQRKDD